MHLPPPHTHETGLTRVFAPSATGFERYLLDWEAWYDRHFLDRGTAWDRLAAFSAATEYRFYGALPRFWHLAALGVDPAAQRRGVGSRLVGWGLERAGREGLPATLEASARGRRLYAKCGFAVLERAPITEGVEGVAMVWEPVGREGEWVVRGKEGEDAVLKEGSVGGKGRS